MDQNSVNKIVSVRNDIRSAVYNLEKTLETVRGSFALVEDVLLKHCPHDWYSAEGESDFCRTCGVTRRPSECEHAVWVSAHGRRDYCLSCKTVKTPALCGEHKWVEGPEDMDHKREFFCAHCGVGQ